MSWVMTSVSTQDRVRRILRRGAARELKKGNVLCVTSTIVFVPLRLLHEVEVDGVWSRATSMLQDDVGELVERIHLHSGWRQLQH